MKNYIRAIACVLVYGFTASAWAQVYVAESFTGTNAPGWVFYTGQGNGPVLTAQEGIDADGDGWLRLTEDAFDQASFVYYDTPISAKDGLIFIFDFVIWTTRGGTYQAADGMTLSLFNADVVPSMGAYGGALGYAQREVDSTQVDGMAGGVVSFGFDAFGNFSRASEGRVGGPGRRENAIAIRGSVGATRMDGYAYQTGTGSLSNFSTHAATSRDDATVHRVRISLTTQQVVRVDLRPEGESWTTVINDYQCTLNCPTNIMFGFTASTGGHSANWELRNIEVSAIPEPSLLLVLLGSGVGLIRWRICT